MSGDNAAWVISLPILFTLLRDAVTRLHGCERLLNRSFQIRHAEGLLNEDTLSTQGRPSNHIASDEHMRNEFDSDDLFDRRHSARFAQSDVDDHQIWTPMRSGGHRIGDIALNRADRMAETLERLCEQYADHWVVFHDQSAQRPHRINSPLRRPRSQTTTFLATSIRPR